MGVLGPYTAAMQMDRSLRDAEAEADAAGVGLAGNVHSKEWLKDSSDRFFGHSGPEIPHRNPRGVAGYLQPDLDARGLRRVADRIHYDVLYGTPKHLVVAVD